MNNNIEILNNKSPKEFVQILKSNELLSKNILFKGGYYTPYIDTNLNNGSVPISIRDIENTIKYLVKEIHMINKKTNKLKKYISENCPKN